VCVEIKGREEDREGFLNAEKAIEGPFAVKLNDGLVGDYALISNDVLTGVVAL
jgi:hypothetical protein